MSSIANPHYLFYDIFHLLITLGTFDIFLVEKMFVNFRQAIQAFLIQSEDYEDKQFELFYFDVYGRSL